MYLENFIGIRKAKGLSLQQIADSIGVSKQLIHQWEKSSVIPNSYAEKVCLLLDLDIKKQEFSQPKFLRDFRLKLGLSSDEMSALLEVNPSTISRWENGNMEISRNATIRLHNLYKAYSSDLKSPESKEGEE